MGNIGEIADLVNSKKAELRVGSDNYIALQNLFVHISRSEERLPTTDMNTTLYLYGKGDSWFTCTILATTPELDSLNTLTQSDAVGDVASTAWFIRYSDRSGGIKNFAVDGYLVTFDIESSVPGGVKMNLFVRILEDTVTVT